MTPSKALFDTSCLETDAKMLDNSGLTSSSQNQQFVRRFPNPQKSAAVLKCSEIDQTTDGVEDFSITPAAIEANVSNQTVEEVSKAVLYEPDIELMV